MSVTSTYAKAWQQHYGLAPGWFVNTQPNDPISLGLKGHLLGDAFQQSGPVARLEALAPKAPKPGKDSEWQFQSSSSIHVETAVKAQTAASIGWLGEAEAGIKASFGGEAGVAATGTHKWFHRFSDMNVVRTALREAVAAGELVEGEAVVVELQLTGKGLLIASNGGDSSIEAVTRGAVAPGGVSLADFSGSLLVTRRDGAVTMEKFGDGAVIAARVMQVGHCGMWWWRKLVVFGLDEVGARQKEMAALMKSEGDGPDEYFLLY